MDWAMRYTFHLGYAPPEFRAQFSGTLGTDDPAAHVQRWREDQRQQRKCRAGANGLERPAHREPRNAQHYFAFRGGGRASLALSANRCTELAPGSARV